MRARDIAFLFLAAGLTGSFVPARAGAAAGAADSPIGDDAIRAAVAKSLPLLERGARGSMEQRPQCFTCHNQGVPILALTTARSRGFAIDAKHLEEQITFTAVFLARNRENYRRGRGQGGQATTAGYALGALADGGWKPDAATAAVAEYLLLYQNDLDHWRSVSRRPPSEQSPFTTTSVALRGLNAFGTPDQRERIDRRLEQVRGWLLATMPHDTEDRVFRLRALRESGAPPERVRGATKELLQTQRRDDGWAQLPDMESDAYATGSALVALHQAGGLAVDDPAYRRGLGYLISTQRDDGSWYVVSRSKPFQTYFESGYPHGKDQFISIAAGGWATTALALALPKTLPGGAEIGGGAAADTARKPKRVRLLTVGNSFSQDATRFLGDLATAAGHVLIHHQASIGGATLAQHWEKAQRHEDDPEDPRGLYATKRSLKQELRAEPWDFITLQQASIRSHDLSTYRPYARGLFDYVKRHAPQAEVLVHQTWAYRCDDPRFAEDRSRLGEPVDQEAMYRGLTAAYRTIAAELGTRLIPVGDAFHRADTDPTWGYRPDTKFDFKDAQRPALPDQTHSLHVGWRWMRPASSTPPLRMDGHHANGAGQYLGACVFYEVLFCESVVGHAFVPRGMDAAYARFLQETAHRAVAESRAKPPPANPPAPPATPSSGDDDPCDVSAAIISDFAPPVPR